MMNRKRGQYTSLTEALVDVEPVRTLAIVQADTNSHAIVALAGNRHQLARYAKVCQHSTEWCGLLRSIASCR